VSIPPEWVRVATGLNIGDKLEKLTITREVEPGQGLAGQGLAGQGLAGQGEGQNIEVQFNPGTMTISRSASWTALGRTTVHPEPAGADDLGETVNLLNFQAKKPDVLSVDLFFDGTGPTPTGSIGSLNDLAPSVDSVKQTLNQIPKSTAQVSDGTSVKDMADKVMSLAVASPNLHRPPICTLEWGPQRFRGVLTDVVEELTMFLPSGEPVRAKLKCTFLEAPTEQNHSVATPSASNGRFWTVTQGQTARALATVAYPDSTTNNTVDWKLIAGANPGRIQRPDDQLTPGIVLFIPSKT